MLISIQELYIRQLVSQNQCLLFYSQYLEAQAGWPNGVKWWTKQQVALVDQDNSMLGQLPETTRKYKKGLMMVSELSRFPNCAS